MHENELKLFDMNKKFNQSEIARQLHISRDVIHGVVNNKTYKWLIIE